MTDQDIINMILRFGNDFLKSLEKFGNDFELLVKNKKSSLHFKVMQISRLCESLSKKIKTDNPHIPWKKIENFIWQYREKYAENPENVRELVTEDITRLLKFCKEFSAN